MAEQLKGLTLQIYRHHEVDCSNGGISSRATRVTLVGIVDRREEPSIPRVLPKDCHVFEPDRLDAPAVMLVIRGMGSQVLYHVEPLEMPNMQTGTYPQTRYMSGGCYVSGDSRFSNLIPFYGAVALHDRQE